MSDIIFTPRLTIPDPDDLNWIKTTYGGYNHCILGSPSYSTGSVLANCTGYCWGRWLELLGATTCNLSTGNGANWYGHTSDGYSRGSTPQLGAIACWGTGAGHVAVVEEITSTYIKCSESGWENYYFRTTDYDLNMTKSGHNFQGFIYLPITYLTLEELVAIIKRRRRYGDL